MIVLMPTILLIGLTNITGMQILVPQNEEKTVLYSVIGGALVDFLLNLALIPLLGSTGAAIGTLAAETAVLIIQFARLRRPLRRLSRRIEWGPLLWGMLFASPVLLISSSLLNAGPFWRLAVCAILFLASMASCFCFAENPF
ncbi:polysaccharide biosynthesis C-terminal domain-containing protein [Allobaculum sp. Allo2]|uniref:polysaccharide biosynthesis C-terminal domain-containing protein n=1 Tax=Allobaculum sp. Allo2 TaxID=2853432 RepID=UPI001F615C75|nr:polysaccharide biosynthesis C-terminal domain-containing protein [Allobaculum sp. Allo2]UNT93532.1 polysaccharide biosynthesis C-terminal domain-containing protein [Allobaculum sp. Allo2]